MLKRLLRSDVLHLLGRQVPQRASRGGQNQPANIRHPVTFHRLEQCAVFAVDREDPDVRLSGFFLHEAAGHDHWLLVGERDRLARFDGRERGEQTGTSDDRGNHQIRFRHRRGLQQALRTA